LLWIDAAPVELKKIAVDEFLRGRGIGGVMVEKAVEIATAGRYREIVLGTEA
jgi:ribosomal protein S18 acetylase RimI-like enzyme